MLSQLDYDGDTEVADSSTLLVFITYVHMYAYTYIHVCAHCAHDVRTCQDT